jgi:2-C-methyl-D-erythritol 4-phosphate cytidylyltransferase
MLTAIIVAAGSSRRMGFDKMFAPLAGKSVIEHTVDAFERADSVNAILVVTRDDRRGDFEKQLRGRTKVQAVIAGGEHRQDSVRAGLQRLSADAKYVAYGRGASTSPPHKLNPSSRVPSNRALRLWWNW